MAQSSFELFRHQEAARQITGRPTAVLYTYHQLAASHRLGLRRKCLDGLGTPGGNGYQTYAMLAI
jgi:hypothetical protein